MTAHLTQKCVLYCRYSSHNQRDVSIDQQIRECTSYAGHLGIEVVKVYADRALSGTSDRRPEFQLMIAEAEKLDYDYVIVYSLDRFARDRYDSAVYKRQLRNCGKKVLSVTEQINDDPTGVLMESLLEGLAEYYSKELGRKIRRGMDDNAAKCMVTGSLPFGYVKGADGRYRLEPQEAAVVREIYSRVLAGEKHRSVMADLNARGIPTKHGAMWSDSSFNTILHNERYTGVYIYGETRIEGGVPQIIDPAQFQAMQEHLGKKKNPRHKAEGIPQRRRRENGTYLLTGKLFCGKCKSPMVGISGKSGGAVPYYYYVCKRHRQEKTCDMGSVRRDEIERDICRAIVEHVFTPENIEAIADLAAQSLAIRAPNAVMDSLRDRLSKTNAAITNLVTAIEKGLYSPSVQARIDALEHEKREILSRIEMEEACTEISLSREDLIAALYLYKDGEITDKTYQETLIDTFLVAAYVYHDGRLHLVLNLNRNATYTLDLATSESISEFAEQCSYNLSSAPPMQDNPNLRPIGQGFGFLVFIRDIKL